MNQKIQIMREGGRKLARIRDRLLKEAKEGISSLQLDKLAEKLIKKAGGRPSFKMIDNYKWATCICVNENIVHCPPKSAKFKKGDLVTVDIGMFYKGYNTDTASTIIIGEKDTKFLQTGKRALNKAIAQAVAGNHVGHISRAMQKVVEKEGYNVALVLVGHGIGRKLHTKPQIPCFLRGKISKTPVLQEGATIAIEVIYMQGNPELELDNRDNWSMRTKDRSQTAMFEHTIAVTSKAPLILT